MQPLQICTTNSSHLFRASERSHVPRRPHQILQLCVFCLVSFFTVWIQCLCIQQIKAYVLSVRVPMKTGSYVAVDLTLKRYFPLGQHSCYQGSPDIKNIPRIGKLPYGAKRGFIERKALLKKCEIWSNSEIWSKF